MCVAQPNFSPGDLLISTLNLLFSLYLMGLLLGRTGGSVSVVYLGCLCYLSLKGQKLG